MLLPAVRVSQLIRYAEELQFYTLNLGYFCEHAAFEWKSSDQSIEEPMKTSLPTFFLSEVDSLFSWDLCLRNLESCYFSDITSVKGNIRIVDSWSKSNQCRCLWPYSSFNKGFANFGFFHYNPIILTFLMADSRVPAKCGNSTVRPNMQCFLYVYTGTPVCGCSCT